MIVTFWKNVSPWRQDDIPSLGEHSQRELDLPSKLVLGIDEIDKHVPGCWVHSRSGV